MAILRNALERSMTRAARDPDAHDDDFFAALLEAKVVLPRPPLRLDAEGHALFTVFSSRAALRRFEPAADDLAEECASQEAFARALALSEPAQVVLNPASDLFYSFSLDEVRALAEGLLPGAARLRPRVLAAGQRIVFAEPTENPVALKMALRPVLESERAIVRAYLVQAADGESTRLFLGLELDLADDDAMAEVVAALDPVLRESLDDETPIDVAMLNGTKLKAACESAGPAFYTRTGA